MLQVPGRRAHRFSRRRAGFTLIEMIVAITLLAVFMTIGVVLLGLLLRTDTAGHEAVAGQLTVARLSRQFRADAHAALDVHPVPDAPAAVEVRLADDSRVVWSTAEGVVQRTVHRTGRVAARESYRLPDATIVLSITPDSGRVTLSVRSPRSVPVETGAVLVALPSDEVRIQAAIGIGRPSPPRATSSAPLTRQEPR